MLFGNTSRQALCQSAFGIEWDSATSVYSVAVKASVTICSNWANISCTCKTCLADDFFVNKDGMCSEAKASISIACYHAMAVIPEQSDACVFGTCR